MNPLSAMPLPVPELAPGPQAGSGKGDGESGDGFADVLQRATGHRQSDSAKGTREDRAGSARAKPAGTESAMEEPPGASDAVAPEGGPARARPERLSREREKAQAEVPMIPLGLAPGPMPAPSPVVAEATTPELGDTPDADLGDALAAGRAAPARPGDATRRTFGPAGEIAGEDARDDGDGRMADASSPVDAEAAATPPGRVATTPATPPEPGTGAAAGALEGVGRATRRPTAAGRTGPRLAATDAAPTSGVAATRTGAAARGGPALPAAPAPTEVQAMSARASMALEPSGHTPGIEGPTGASASGDIATATPGVPASPANPGAPRAAALPVAAPVFSPAFPQALGQQLVMALRMDLDQAELILSPAELGPVRVELSLDGNAASVHFTAPNPDTRQALERSLADLGALLAEQGLSLADTHVGPGFHREHDGSPADAAPPRRSAQRPVATVDGPARPLGLNRRPDALVDLFA